jgi:hypothetical protein
LLRDIGEIRSACRVVTVNHKVGDWLGELEVDGRILSLLLNLALNWIHLVL